MVRHPLDTITSLLTCFCKEANLTDLSDSELEVEAMWTAASWRLVSDHLIALPSGESPLARAAHYWLNWNALVEARLEPRYRFRVEDMKLQELVVQLGSASNKTTVAAAKAVDDRAAAALRASGGGGRGGGSGKKGRKSAGVQRIAAPGTAHLNVEWGDLKRVVPELYPRIVQAAARYGYGAP